LLDLPVADGYRPEVLGQAWMEFKEPKPAEAIAHFIDLGAERLLCFSAAISADSSHSL